MSTPYACRRIQEIIDNKIQRKGKGSKILKIHSLKGEEGRKSTQSYGDQMIAKTKIKHIEFENVNESQKYHHELVRLLDEKKKKMVLKAEKKHFLDKLLGSSRFDWVFGFEVNTDIFSIFHLYVIHRFNTSIDMQHYEVVDLIGEGAYGVVLKAKRKEDGCPVAIKKFK